MMIINTRRYKTCLVLTPRITLLPFYFNPQTFFHRFPHPPMRLSYPYKPINAQSANLQFIQDSVWRAHGYDKEMERGLKRHELANHLGNGLVVKSDEWLTNCLGDPDGYKSNFIKKKKYVCS